MSWLLFIGSIVASAIRRKRTLPPPSLFVLTIASIANIHQQLLVYALDALNLQFSHSCTILKWVSLIGASVFSIWIIEHSKYNRVCRTPATSSIFNIWKWFVKAKLAFRFRYSARGARANNPTVLHQFSLLVIMNKTIYLRTYICTDMALFAWIIIWKHALTHRKHRINNMDFFF